MITTPCERCQGQGRVRNNRRVVVNIPAGVDDGITVRVTGEGEAPRAAAHLAISIQSDGQAPPIFKRQGNDVIYELPLSFAQAALGAEVAVHTLEGKQTIKIPAGTQSGRSFRLKGMGVPVVHSTARGDQHVTVKLVTPRRPDQAPDGIAERVCRDRAQQNEKGAQNLFERGFEKIKDALQFE